VSPNAQAVGVGLKAALMHRLLLLALLLGAQEVEALAPEDRPASPWWKCRKWIMSIAYRVLSRYGEPKHCKDGNDKAFGELFKVREGGEGGARAHCGHCGHCGHTASSVCGRHAEDLTLRQCGAMAVSGCGCECVCAHQPVFALLHGSCMHAPESCTRPERGHAVSQPACPAARDPGVACRTYRGPHTHHISPQRTSSQTCPCRLDKEPPFVPRSFCCDPIVLVLQRNWSLRLLDAQVALVARLAAGQYLSPRVTNSLFQYLSYALDIKECYK